MRPADPIPPILLVGMGRMGNAMVHGWRQRKLSPSYAVDPAAASAAALDLRLVSEAADIPDDFTPAAVVLAVKPQFAAAALPAYRRFAGRAVFLSIMAGRTIGGLRAALGPQAAVVRAMPNTPAAIQQGITVACAGPGVSSADQDLCDALLRAVGEVAWTPDETLLDAVTAVSGSGPAYVFLLAELLETAAREQGIPPALARLLARRTVAGAGALLVAGDVDAADLRQGVTSRAGTTERALSVLMEAAAWPALVSRAVAAATQRSRELAD